MTIFQDGQCHGAASHHSSCRLSGRPATLPATAGQIAAVAGQDRKEGVQSPGDRSGQLGSKKTRRQERIRTGPKRTESFWKWEVHPKKEKTEFWHSELKTRGKCHGKTNSPLCFDEEVCRTICLVILEERPRWNSVQSTVGMFNPLYYPVSVSFYGRDTRDEVLCRINFLIQCYYKCVRSQYDFKCPSTFTEINTAAMSPSSISQNNRISAMPSCSNVNSSRLKLSLFIVSVAFFFFFFFIKRPFCPPDCCTHGCRPDGGVM